MKNELINHELSDARNLLLRKVPSSDVEDSLKVTEDLRNCRCFKDPFFGRYSHGIRYFLININMTF